MICNRAKVTTGIWLVTDIAAASAAKAVPKDLLGCDDKGWVFVFIIRERAPAYMPLAVLFKCAACGLFDIGLEVCTGFDGVYYGLFCHRTFPPCWIGLFLISSGRCDRKMKTITKRFCPL